MAVVGKGKGDQSEYLHAVLDVYCANNLVKDSKELQAIFSRPSEGLASQYSQYCIKILHDNSDRMGYFVCIQMNEETGQKSVDQVPSCDERNTMGGDLNTLTIDGGGEVEKFDIQTHIESKALKEITVDDGTYHDGPTTDLAKESMPLADCARLVDASAATCLTDTSMATYYTLKSTT